MFNRAMLLAFLSMLLCLAGCGGGEEQKKNRNRRPSHLLQNLRKRTSLFTS